MPRKDDDVIEPDVLTKQWEEDNLDNACREKFGKDRKAWIKDAVDSGKMTEQQACREINRITKNLVDASKREQEKRDLDLVRGIKTIHPK